MHTPWRGSWRVLTCYATTRHHDHTRKGRVVKRSAENSRTATPGSKCRRNRSWGADWWLATGPPADYHHSSVDRAAPVLNLGSVPFVILSPSASLRTGFTKNLTSCEHRQRANRPAGPAAGADWWLCEPARRRITKVAQRPASAHAHFWSVATQARARNGPWQAKRGDGVGRDVRR